MPRKLSQHSQQPSEARPHEAGEKRKPTQVEIDAKDLRGVQYFKCIRPLLESLRRIGTERDVAGNRDLYMDQYCVLVLMWLFNPVLDSLRALQQASGLEQVQKRFEVGRASLGSLSESVSIFDPEPLKRIAESLATEIPSGDPSRFDAIGKQLTAVDGSVFKTAVRVASLAWLPSKGNGQNKSSPLCGYRMHTHFEILRGIPERIDLTAAKPKGQDDERAVLARTLRSDHCYVIDRGYAKFELFNQIHAIGSSYICRARDNSAPKILAERELTEADRAAGVIADREVLLGDPTKHDKAVATDHRVRMIEIRVAPHVRTGKGGLDSDGILRLVTDLMDVPAELIAEAYRLRWLIEVCQAGYTASTCLYLLAA